MKSRIDPKFSCICDHHGCTFALRPTVHGLERDYLTREQIEDSSDPPAFGTRRERGETDRLHFSWLSLG